MTLPQIDWKKAGLILGFVLAVILIGWIIYYFFFRPFIAPPAVTPPPTVTPTLPPVSLGVPPTVVTPPAVTPGAPVSPETTISPTASATGLTATTAIISIPAEATTLASNGRDLLYYDRSAGKFYRLDSTGKTTSLTDKFFYNVAKVTWSPDTVKSIIEYQDGSKIYYNFDTKEQAAIPNQWKDFSFDPNSNKVAFKEMNYDSSNRWVSTANADGTGLQAVEHLGTKDADVLISWSPSNQTVALYRESTSANEAEVYFIGLHGENFKSLRVNGRDLRAIWSPSGQRLLYSVYGFDSGYVPSLWSAKALGDSIGTDRTIFGLATWADKCAFADDITAYCAVPKTIDSGAGYFPSLTSDTPDLIYKLNTETGEKTKIAEPLGGNSISKIMVTSDQKSLYFTDKNTNQVYKLDL